MIESSHSQFGKIEDILQQLDSGPLDKEMENRRGAPRLNVRLSLEAVVLAGTNFCPIRIFTRNLSVSGAGFVSRRLLTAGERIVISLQTSGKPAKLILAQVTFGRYVRAGMYEMGAKFLEAVDDANGQGVVPKRWTVKPPNPGDPTVIKTDAGPKGAAAEGQKESESDAPAGR